MRGRQGPWEPARCPCAASHAFTLALHRPGGCAAVPLARGTKRGSVRLSLCCGIVLTVGHHQGPAAGSCSPAGGCCWPGHRALAGLTATVRGGAQMATTAPDPQGQFRAGLRAAAAPPCSFGRLCVPNRSPITLYPSYIHIYIRTYTYMCIYKDIYPSLLG